MSDMTNEEREALIEKTIREQQDQRDARGLNPLKQVSSDRHFNIHNAEERR